MTGRIIKDAQELVAIAFSRELTFVSQANVFTVIPMMKGQLHRPETFGKELQLKHGTFVHNLFFNEHFCYYYFLKC